MNSMPGTKSFVIQELDEIGCNQETMHRVLTVIHHQLKLKYSLTRLSRPCRSGFYLARSGGGDIRGQVNQVIHLSLSLPLPPSPVPFAHSL